MTKRQRWKLVSELPKHSQKRMNNIIAAAHRAAYDGDLEKIRAIFAYFASDKIIINKSNILDKYNHHATSRS